MANWAKLDENNVVTNVVVTDNGDPDEGLGWLTANLGGVWVQTSYNTRGGVYYVDGEPGANQSKALRGNYASIGFSYDETLDAFIPPKPFDSWLLDETIFNWVAPVPYPEDGKRYEWDEDVVAWVEVADEAV